MSSVHDDNEFKAELVFTLVPSRYLLVFIVLTHLLGLCVLLFLPLAFWLSGLLGLLVVGSLIYNGLLHSGRLARRWVEVLYWRESGGWELTTATGEHLPAIFCDSSFSSLYVDVLNFKVRAALGGRRFTVILLRDNSDVALRRRLRMRLGLS